MEIQQRMSGVLSEFARTLATDFSIQAILDQLVVRVVDVLPVDAAGVMLMSPRAEFGYVAASDEAALQCERLQAGVGEGPSLAAHASGEPVTVNDLRIDDRFPEFAPLAVEAGIAAVLSFPLRHGDVPLGALDLYRRAAGPFDAAAMAGAQTLADVTSAYLLIAQSRVDFEDASERARVSSLHDGESVRALRISEQRKTAILASALDAVITIDEHGSVVEFNPAAERTFGYSGAEARDCDLARLVAPPPALQGGWVDLEGFLAVHDGPLLGRRIELVGTRSDGTTFPAEVSITAVAGAGPPFFTAFIRDLTEREAADAERRSLEGRVQQTERLESLGQLAGGVAHDFNNLLTVILNYAIFIAERSENDDDTRFQAGEIVTSAERAARLTHQLLLFARREPVRRTPIDINGIVADVHDLLERVIGDHVELVVFPATDLPLVTGDRGQIEQLLMNLALNARDAMPSGGTVTIETSVVRRSHGSFVQLSVADTGHGMDAAVVSHAFEPFFTTKGAGEGSGLGLATVYGIVTDAGGTVELTSEEGVGTTFSVQLPATGHLVTAAPPAAMAGPVRGSGETIMVVDDQPSVRSIIVAMLNRNGYRVLEAPDADAALAIAETATFDLLLTDVLMPGRSGPELAQELNARHPGHEVLYMSAASAGLVVEHGPPGSREVLIHKPFKEAALLVAVHAALAAAGTAWTSVRPPVAVATPTGAP